MPSPRCHGPVLVHPQRRRAERTAGTRFMFPHPAQALPGSVPAPERVATEVEGDGDGKHRQRPGKGGTVAITLNTVADAATSVR
jgi:hypothetical protein